MQTATQAAYTEMKNAAKQATLALAAVAKEEFPLGATVRWIHTFKRKAGEDIPQYLEGQVTGHGYYGSTCFDIRRSTGTEYRIEAHRLEPVRPNT